VIRVSDIQDTVARNFNLAPALIRDPTRRRSVSMPRQIAMMLSREMTHLSLPAIGREFRRDHTTIIHGISAAKRMIGDDPALARRVDSIRHIIEINRPSIADSWARVFNHIEDPVARKLTIIAKHDRGELTDLETRELIRRCDLVTA
jgi:hypothetical protein